MTYLARGWDREVMSRNRQKLQCGYSSLGKLLSTSFLEHWGEHYCQAWTSWRMGPVAKGMTVVVVTHFQLCMGAMLCC